MALVGKSGRDRDFRQRKLGLTKHALRSIQPPAQKVAVRRHSHRLVECPCEMMSGKPRHRSQRLQPDFLVQMGFDVLADALGEYRRQPPTAGRERLGGRHLPQRADPRPAVHHRFRAAPRHSGFAQGRSKQRIPPSSAAGPHDPGRDVPVASLSKEQTVEFESRRQGNTARKPVIIQAKEVPRNAVGAHASIGARPPPEAMRARCRRAAQRSSRRGGNIPETSVLRWLARRP